MKKLLLFLALVTISSSFAFPDGREVIYSPADKWSGHESHAWVSNGDIGAHFGTVSGWKWYVERATQLYIDGQWEVNQLGEGISNGETMLFVAKAGGWQRALSDAGASAYAQWVPNTNILKVESELAADVNTTTYIFAPRDYPALIYYVVWNNNNSGSVTDTGVGLIVDPALHGTEAGDTGNYNSTYDFIYANESNLFLGFASNLNFTSYQVGNESETTQGSNNTQAQTDWQDDGALQNDSFFQSTGSNYVDLGARADLGTIGAGQSKSAWFFVTYGRNLTELSDRVRTMKNLNASKLLDNETLWWNNWLKNKTTINTPNATVNAMYNQTLVAMKSFQNKNSTFISSPYIFRWIYRDSHSIAKNLGSAGGWEELGDYLLAMNGSVVDESIGRYYNVWLPNVTPYSYSTEATDVNMWLSESLSAYYDLTGNVSMLNATYRDLVKEPWDWTFGYGWWNTSTNLIKGSQTVWDPAANASVEASGDTNSIAYYNLQYASRIASLLGYANESTAWNEYRNNISTGMLGNLWNTTGQYMSAQLNVSGNKQAQIWTDTAPAGWAGIVPSGNLSKWVSTVNGTLSTESGLLRDGEPSSEDVKIMTHIWWMKNAIKSGNDTLAWQWFDNLIDEGPILYTLPEATKADGNWTHVNIFPWAMGYFANFMVEEALGVRYNASALSELRPSLNPDWPWMEASIRVYPNDSLYVNISNGTITVSATTGIHGLKYYNDVNVSSARVRNGSYLINVDGNVIVIPEISGTQQAIDIVEGQYNASVPRMAVSSGNATLLKSEWNETAGRILINVTGGGSSNITVNATANVSIFFSLSFAEVELDNVSLPVRVSSNETWEITYAENASRPYLQKAEVSLESMIWNGSVFNATVSGNGTDKLVRIFVPDVYAGGFKVTDNGTLIGTYSSAGLVDIRLNMSVHAIAVEPVLAAAEAAASDETVAALAGGCIDGIEIHAPENLSGMSGAEIAVPFILKNNGTCVLRNFNVSVEVPDGWNASNAAISELHARQNTSSALSVRSPESADGNYSVVIVAKNGRKAIVLTIENPGKRYDGARTADGGKTAVPAGNPQAIPVPAIAALIAAGIAYYVMKKRQLRDSRRQKKRLLRPKNR